MEWISHERDIEIQSAFHGGQVKIGKYKVERYHDGRIFDFMETIGIAIQTCKNFKMKTPNIFCESVKIIHA